jgi:hypothetical protein
LTLRDFLARVAAHYGLRLCRTSAFHPQGGQMEIWYLQSEDKEPWDEKELDLEG